MKRLRILQADPSSVLGTTTVERLEKLGHEVSIDVESDPSRGLDRLQTEQFDCVVFADELPKMDGLEFLERVRETHPDLPAILITSQNDQDRLEAALSAGATEVVRNFGQAEDHKLLAKRIHDAVERRRIEQERDDKEQFIDQLFENVPASLYVKDEQARHVRLSGFYGVGPEIAKGKTDRELYSYNAEESYRDDRQVIQTGEPIHNQVEHLPSEDEWNMTSKAPWYGEDDEIKGLIGVTVQITEQKEAEQALQQQNERLNKFTRIVSHELRNPLQVARGRTELLRDTGDTEHSVAILEALDRINELIEYLNGLAHGGQPLDENEPFSLEDAVEKCWQTTETRDATLRLATDARIRANRGQLEQLLENLFENAVEHGGNAVTITVGRSKSASGFFIADDGSGIPESERDEVFDIGYSTGGERTGFGLATVAEIATTHGWDIELTSSEDGGARFEFTDVDFVE